MGYSRRTLDYLQIITLFDPTHIMSMTDFVTIDVEILRMDSGCFLEIEFTALI